MPNNDDGVIIDGRATRWLLGILSVLVVYLVTTSFTRLHELERWQASTEGNRFTDDDALEMYRDLQRYHDENTPPAEVRLLLDQFDERLDRLEAGR